MMKRPPWIAIVLGLCAWGLVIALAVNDIWWPMWVAGGVTATALVGGAVMALWLRRFTRNNPAKLVRESPEPARDEPIAEPPKATGRPGPRTNMRTAGRRNKGGAAAIVVGLFVLQAQGCERGGDAKSDAKSGDAKSDAKGGDAKTGDAKGGDAKAAKPATPAGPASDDPALEAALARAIRAPLTGEATYQVDPFVAAIVFERVKMGTGPTFTKLDKPIEAGPQTGYVVGEVADGSLAHRLGLRTGDVIEAMNGVVLTGGDRIGFALDGASTRVELTIYRDEVSVVQRYELTNALAWTELLAGFTGAADPRLAAADGGALDGGAGDEGTPVDDGRGAGAEPVEPATPEPASDDGGTTPTPTPTPSGGGKLPSGGGTTPKPSPGTTPKPSPGTTPKPNPGTTPPPPSGTTQVSCESSSKCTIQKAYFDSLVSNPSKLESQANIVPAIQNDIHSGYKLKSIKPGSAISKLGFQSNDKITHINGYDLTDDFQAAQLYMGVSSTKIFKIRYERGTARLVKTVVVK
jgi:type II secretory pathway component PulC